MTDGKEIKKPTMPNIKRAAMILLVLLVTSLCPALLQAQMQDSRYDSGLNLPFNEKAGDVNPQTGNITLSFTDVKLPGSVAARNILSTIPA